MSGWKHRRADGRWKLEPQWKVPGGARTRMEIDAYQPIAHFSFAQAAVDLPQAPETLNPRGSHLPHAALPDRLPISGHAFVSGPE